MSEQKPGDKHTANDSIVGTHKKPHTGASHRKRNESGHIANNGGMANGQRRRGDRPPSYGNKPSGTNRHIPGRGADGQQTRSDRSPSYGYGNKPSGTAHHTPSMGTHGQQQRGGRYHKRSYPTTNTTENAAMHNSQTEARRVSPPKSFPIATKRERTPHNASATKPAKQQIPTLARRIALDALIDVHEGGAFSTLSLDRHLSAYPSMPREDKRLATALFYGVIERKLALDYALGQFMQKPPDDEVTYINLRLAALQMLYMNVPDYAACGEAVAMSRYKGREALCPLVNAVLRELSRKKTEIKWPEDPLERLSVQTSTPLWLVNILIQQKGEEFTRAFLNYTPQEHFMVIRINPMRTNREEVSLTLSAAGMQCSASPVPGALRVSGGSPADTREYKQGLFSIQGEASMLAALALGVKRGEQILDACAAPGGKACMLAEIMNGSGRVHAMDIHPHRVKLIEAQAKRLGLDNVRPRIGDSTKPIESMRDSLNAVLIDAPCSGLGVISGKPDIKYNLNREQLDKLPGAQLSMLNACSQAVRKGGAIVYSTCTILRAENEGVVEKFLSMNPNFILHGLEQRLPEPFASRVNDGMLSLEPERDGTDGFFIARLERKT